MENHGTPFTLFHSDDEEFVPGTPIPDPMNVTNDHLCEIDLTPERRILSLSHMPRYEDVWLTINANEVKNNQNASFEGERKSTKQLTLI